MEKYYEIRINNNIQTQDKLQEIVDVIYLKVEGEKLEGIHLSNIHPSRIETKNLEIKELNKDVYEQRKQILEQKLNNNK